MTTWLLKKVDDWLKGDCISCDDEWHTSAEKPPPKYVTPYIEGLAGPDEQHGLSQGTCQNPKCGHDFTPDEVEYSVGNGDWVTCPECGFKQNLAPGDANGTQTWIPGEDGRAKLNPGGITRSGLTLKDMGQIGEAIVLRLGEIPGVGPIRPVEGLYHFPIDAIIDGQKGSFGVEIKSNHSQAKPRFRIGDGAERHTKIEYCLTHGLKPALIGVRLNFFTDLAYVFFREGFTDTWIGNDKMHHVGTYDFSDLNPFKSPDPQAQSLAVENANIPDQSEEDEFDQYFGPVTSASEDDQPRDSEGKFTFKGDVHEIKVKDKKGKHTHTIKRCQHCGGVYGKHPAHHGRSECPSCGQDPERKLSMARVVLADGSGADKMAKEMGFGYLGRSGEGHRKYNWADPSGVNHVVILSSGRNKHMDYIDTSLARQRMSKCLAGKCNHVFTGGQIEEDGMPGQPLFKTGQTIQTGGHFGIVLETNGEASLVQNYETQEKGWVPNDRIQAVAASDEPDYLYVYYMSELLVKPFEVGLRSERMLKALFEEFGDSLTHSLYDVDTTDVDTGEIWVVGDDIEIRHTQLSKPEVREYAERAVENWWLDQPHEKEDDGWATLPSDDLTLS